MPRKRHGRRVYPPPFFIVLFTFIYRLKLPMHSKSKWFSLAVPAVVLGLASASAWSSEVLISGGGVSITRNDINADAVRLPEEARRRALSNPETVEQQATNLLVRRIMAAELEKRPQFKDPQLQAALALARDRVLSDAYLSLHDEKEPVSEEAMESYARSQYQANPDRYKAPADRRARHILLPLTPEGKAKAEKLLADIKAGADFEALAKAESKDVGSGLKGGDLGYFSRGRMVAPFEEAAFAITKANEFAPVVETQFGYHVIQVTDIREARTLPFEEVRMGLRVEAANKLLQEARVREARRLLENAKPDKAAIEAFSKTFGEPAKR